MDYRYRCQVVRVVDGDTIIVQIDLGLHCYHVESLRLFGVNAPEIFSGSARDAGAAARDFTRGWVAEAAVKQFSDLWPFTVQTYKDQQTFGRYVALLTRNDTGESLADALVAAGHAVWDR